MELDFLAYTSFSLSTTILAKFIGLLNMRAYINLPSFVLICSLEPFFGTNMFIIIWVVIHCWSFGVVGLFQ